MKRIMLKSKIHSLIVTETKLEYEGSITIGAELLEAADLLAGEKVQVLNYDNGNRLETYIIKGPAGSTNVCMNGPAAHKCGIGEKVVVIGYGVFEDDEARTFKPSIVITNPDNTIKEVLNS